MQADFECGPRILTRGLITVRRGQAISRPLSEINTNIFFLLKAKCTLVPDELEVSFGQVALVHQQHPPGKNNT